jgi:hemoglobin
MGGFAKVRLLVSEFYDRVLDSDTLAPYFDGIDMRRLIDHQT